MSKTALDTFGKLLMTEVRDESISHWKMIIDGRMKGELAEKARRDMAALSDEHKRAILALVPQIVDTALHQFLTMFERQQNLVLALRTPGTAAVNLRDASDGLAGELYSDEGWIARFSRET